MSNPTDIRSHFSIFAEKYKPPEEFFVFLPGGEAMVFKGMRSATELEEMRARLHKTITAIKKAPNVQYQPFVGESDTIWAKAFRLQATMIGFHLASEVDGRVRKPSGERLPPFTPLEMIEFASVAAPTFENVDFDWEIAQYRAVGAAEIDEVLDLKKD